MAKDKEFIEVPVYERGKLIEYIKVPNVLYSDALNCKDDYSRNK